MNLGIVAAVGAALGSLLRFGVSQVVDSANYPWATFSVNVAGSFLIGFLIALPAFHGHDQRRVFLITGVLGGFTTFSAVAIESLQMNAQAALIYIFASVLSGTFAATVAFKLSSRLS